MRKLTFIERWGLVVLLVMGVMYVYLTYYRDGFIQEHSALVKKNNSLVAALNGTTAPDTTDAIQQANSKLQTELRDLTTQFDKVKKERLADLTAEEETVMRINDLAAYLGLQIGQMGPYRGDEKSLFTQVQKEQKALNRLLYQVQLTGSYASLYDFVNEIKKLPTIVNITNMNIQRNKDTGKLRVDLLFLL